MKKVNILVIPLLALLLVFIMAVNASAAFVPASALTAKNATTAPTIDGKITPEEWGDPVQVYEWSDGTVLPEQLDDPKAWLFYNGGDGREVELAKATKIKYYLTWDDANFYLGAETDDPCPVGQDMEAGSIWMDRCIQVEWVKDDGMFMDAGFAVNGDGETLQFSFMDGQDIALNAKVVQEGTKITYEIAFPWSYLEIAGAGAGKTIGITTSFNLHVKAAPFYCIQFGASIMNKLAEDLLPITLSADPAFVPPETTEQDPAPEVSAPPTSDTGYALLAVIAFMAAVSFTVLKKRRAVK